MSSPYKRVLTDLGLTNASQPPAERILYTALTLADQLDGSPPTDTNYYRGVLGVLTPIFAGSNFFDDVTEILRRGAERLRVWSGVRKYWEVRDPRTRAALKEKFEAAVDGYRKVPSSMPGVQEFVRGEMHFFRAANGDMHGYYDEASQRGAWLAAMADMRLLPRWLHFSLCIDGCLVAHSPIEDVYIPTDVPFLYRRAVKRMIDKVSRKS